MTVHKVHFSPAADGCITTIGSTGAHTREVLREHGLSDAQIDALVAEGVVAEGTVPGAGP